MKRMLQAGCAAVAVLVVAGPAVRAVDQDAINQAIERGVEYLHQREVLSGVVTQPVGATALVGLTLLECGAKTDDASVRSAAQTVRQAAVSMRDTYTLSLSISFSTVSATRPTNRSSSRWPWPLMGGQSGNGGWTYVCPDLPEAEVRRLTNVVQHPDQAVPPDKPKDPDAKPTRPNTKDLPKEIQDQIVRLNALPVPAADLQQLGMPDNSNTQFAALGLWVARRHGLPVDKALARLDRRFRASQSADGGWAYVAGMPINTTTPIPAAPCRTWGASSAVPVRP